MKSRKNILLILAVLLIFTFTACANEATLKDEEKPMEEKPAAAPEANEMMTEPLAEAPASAPEENSTATEEPAPPEESSTTTEEPAAPEETPMEEKGEEMTEEKVFTLEELKQYDGQDGRPAYVAVDGIVYDLTESRAWRNGKHNGFSAGMDLTEEIKNISPHGVKNLEGIPIVGKLADD